MHADKLHVIAVISNPVRYRTRYNLYENFKKQMLDAGVNLITVELALGDRPFAVTTREDANNIQFRNVEECWQKEAMINVGISRLPDDWQYVAWIDSDVQFARPDWAAETVHQLQHYKVVQMFSHAIDLGPDYQPLQRHRGFMAMWHENGFKRPEGAGYSYYAYSRKPNSSTFWHPGYCWAACRDAIDDLGGLMDFPILGSADHHMAMALIGCAEKTYPSTVTQEYKNKTLIWQDRATKHIKQDVGYVDGTIYHYFHGKKQSRGYESRWNILTENQFNPETDIKRDWQGLWQLVEDSPRQWRIRDQIRAYFRSRNEDDISL